jgi:ATP-binding cassette subfamily B protein
MEPLHFEARGTFRVPPAALWPLVSDTARMNRAIGVPPVTHTVTPLDGGGSRLEGEIRLAGFPLARYLEHPFRWEAPHGFVVVRELPRGPLQRIRAGARLTPVEGGTEVVIYGDFVPRTVVGALLGRLIGPRSVNNTIRQCRAFERYLLGEIDQPYASLARLPRFRWLRGHREATPGRVEADPLIAHGLSREAVELLRRYLAEAPDEDVARMGPFELADAWGLDRHDTLGLFLHATAARLLTMRWDVLCPNCRVSKARADSLRELVEQAHCDTCNISFDAAFDRSVEVRFAVARSIRAVFTDEYCVGGPMNTPHVLAQTVVPPGGTERLACQLQPGPYRLRPRGSRGRLMLAANDQPGPDSAETPLAVTVQSEAVEPAVADVAAGTLVLEVVNATDREQVVLVEDNLWPDTVVTAAMVCANQEFRDLFPSETLAPGVRLGIESLAFVAVHLTPQPPPPAPASGGGGDGKPPLVLPTGGRRGVAETVRAHRGAVVRSDDGVLLAAFASVTDAVSAAVQLRRDVSGLQIGVHHGACVAANVAGRLEYAGQTVELADGLARAGQPGEIVASLDVGRAVGVASLLQASGLRLDDALLHLPGVQEAVPAIRALPPDPASPQPALPDPVDAPASLTENPTLLGATALRDWLARRHGPLRFDFRPDSYAGERIDAIVAAYAATLDRILAFVGREVLTLPPILIRLESPSPIALVDAREGEVWVFPDGTGQAGVMGVGASLAPLSVGAQGIAPSTVAPQAGSRGLEATVVMTAEAPGPSPELVLSPLVLDALFGPGQPTGRFWTDGLAGHLAAEAGSEEHAGAPRRALKVHEEGQFPPLADQVQQRAERASPVATLTATAFVTHLIQSRGPERFCRLLRASRAGRTDAFRRVYGQPIAGAEGRWLHTLEAADQGSKRVVLAALSDLLPYFRTYWRHLAAILALILLGLLFDLFTPLALSFLVDNVLHRTPLGRSIPFVGAAGDRIALEEQLPTLIKVLVVMGVMLIVNVFSRLEQTRLLALIGEGVTLDLRRRFFERLQRLPVSFHAKTSSTDISQRFFTDIGQVPAALSTGLSLVINGVAMVMFGSTLLSLNLWLGLVAISGLPFFALAARYGRSAMRQASRERGRRASEIQQALFENLAGQRFLRIWNACNGVRERFEQRLEVHRDLNIRTAMLGQALARASGIITNVAQLAVLGLGGLLVIMSSGEQLSPGGLMAAYLLLMRLYLPAGSFAGAIQSLEQAADALTRLRKVLDAPVEDEPERASALAPLAGALVLDDLVLVQQNGKARLRGLSAEIRAGTKVAFVGGTGSGAAGLLTLLPRLDEPASGRILWDGQDVREAAREALRNQIVVVQQDTFVVRGTIYDNVRLTKPTASEAEVLAASQTAGLHESVIALPNGYDTVVGDRDAVLTTALRQRLGVARALLAGGSVVLMDDATAALDNHAQRELETALRGPDGTRTLIRVTQRLSTIADADDIYVLEDGRIVERGTHENLIARGGLYLQLLNDELGDANLGGARQAVRRLSKLAPFSQLPPAVLEDLARLALFMMREAGQEIVRQGSHSDELFIIGRGELEVIVRDEQGEDRLINVLGEGDYVGEISFLRGVARTATLRARTPTELYVLRRLDVDQLLARLGLGLLTEHPELMDQMESTARARLEDTAAHLATLPA